MEKRKTRSVLKEALKLVFLGFCVYATTDFSLPPEIVEMSNATSGGKFVYLTIITLYLTIISTVLGYISKTRVGKRLEEIYKDMLAVTFSLEGIVTTLFWSLYFINPTLLKNKSLYKRGIRESFLTELSAHLFPIILLLICQADVRLQKRKRCIYFIFGFGALYFLEICYFSFVNNGKWAYPIFRKMGWVQRILFVLIACFIGTLFYMGLLATNSLIYQEYEQPNEND
ncbi:hypothetical protein EROM_030940 [Encephalitozoon romaleae SJ-2008]|uniref:FAR-17a/AIG1-like protein n=1 Tax=Encephalitozoon romaleae (strain SJ-2008) TaxID=1178016 RepID=I7ADR2_ENCRO|nr:hypothetical protein EROM_030940 [Encephalitozoon romaleae SJ-2008]AFN82715.1 hypothetical protein EROM_030940 [Encephalitozoon romaleae SJ-2008]